ncbi:MAG: RseA family anti-sigma factor, partial [Aquabacterium sp.]
MMDRSEKPADGRDAKRQRMSDLMDGRVDADAPSSVQAWASDADLRASWHAYHLAADVMRSDDLASPAGQDEAFLQRLRLRLAQEPVPFAPQALVAVAGPASPRRAAARR